MAHTGNLIFVTREQFPKLNIKDNRLETLFSKRWAREEQFKLYSQTFLGEVTGFSRGNFNDNRSGFIPDLSFLKEQ